MEKKVAFCTLGCKVNQYESEAVAEQFLSRGYTMVDFSESATVYVVNTCTVTHLSDRKSRQMIRRAKQINPDALLVVMGCYAQTAPETVAAISEVDLVIGTDKRGTVAALAEELLSNRHRVNLVEAETATEFEALTVDGSGQTHTRAVLKVQDGCNQFCSYCIIPYARGRIRSRSLADTVAEAKRLVKAGFCELVLTGIHLASWGKDSGEGTLLDLLCALQEVDGIERIRLGSLEPTLCTQAFVDGVATLSKVCRHFHLSLQSGCDATLRRMNRKYSAADYAEAVARIREKMPQAAITTDVIVGFPQESDAEFETTMAFMEKLQLADVHVFKYSPRKGTPAAKMTGQISPEKKEERSRRLIDLAADHAASYAQGFVDEILPILFEEAAKDGFFEGKTDTYLAVFAKTETDLTGKIRRVHITENRRGMLFGEIVDEYFGIESSQTE